MAAPTRDLFLRHYALDPTSIRGIPQPGLENTGYVLEGTAGRYLARVSHYRSLAELTEEVSYIQRIRKAGFLLVPSPVLTIGGEAICPTEDGFLFLYEFIPGEITEALTAKQFEGLLRKIPEYLAVAAQAGDYSYPHRPHFPAPELVLSTLHQRPECTNESQLTSVLRELQPLPTELLIHGDLHAGNLIWSDVNTLAGVIDFDDCCNSCSAVEVLALIRGTCFRTDRIDRSKLEALLLATGAWLHHPSIAEKLAEYLSYVCVYFFIAVNRPRPWRVAGPVDDLDLRRARCVLEQRKELNEVWMSTW
jgi:Ser/Thr protein kinase RdoA (MazF antagonist)